jgi:hypothetical protein
MGHRSPSGPDYGNQLATRGMRDYSNGISKGLAPSNASAMRWFQTRERQRKSGTAPQCDSPDYRPTSANLANSRSAPECDGAPGTVPSPAAAAFARIWRSFLDDLAVAVPGSVPMAASNRDSALRTQEPPLEPIHSCATRFGKFCSISRDASS